MVHWYPNFDPYHAIVFWTVRFCLAIVADEHVGQPRAQSPSNGGGWSPCLEVLPSWLELPWPRPLFKKSPTNLRGAPSSLWFVVFQAAAKNTR
jgi:hypothetical protein